MTVKIDDALWAAEIISPHLVSGEDLTIEQIAMNLVRSGEKDEDQE